MSLCEKILAGRFIVTSEIAPPKGTDTAQMLRDAALLSSRVDAVNVTDLQSSVMRLGSLAVCKILRDQGIEPVFQMTCRDRNRLALQSDLLSAAAFGIENVLALTGDYTTLGDHPEAKPVFDLDSVSLLSTACRLAEGFDMTGHALSGIPRFCLGAVVNPGADPLEPEIIKMEKKIAAGAKFFQTQAVFDVDTFKAFLAAAAHLKTTVLAGVVLVKSAAMARFMNKNVAGVSVPESLIRALEAAPDRAAFCVETAARLIRDVKPLCQGVHIMPIGWADKVPLVLDAAGL